MTQDASGPPAGSMSTGCDQVRPLSREMAEMMCWPGLSFDALTRGQDAEPVAVVGNDDVRLIAVAFVGDHEAVADIAGIRRFGGAGECQKQGCGKSHRLRLSEPPAPLHLIRDRREFFRGQRLAAEGDQPLVFRRDVARRDHEVWRPRRGSDREAPGPEPVASRPQAPSTWPKCARLPRAPIPAAPGRQSLQPGYDRGAGERRFVPRPRYAALRWIP